MDNIAITLTGGLIIEKIISIIFPPICGICGKINQNHLCKKCELILKRHSKNIVLTDEIELMYLFKYEELIRDLIIQFKFNNKPFISKTLGSFLVNNKNVFEFIKNYDTIIPVPISKKRQKERGYNQSLLIAKEIIRSEINLKEIEIKLMDNNLIKTKNIIEQSKLSEEKRKNNIKGAYFLKNKEQVKGRKILLIDDVYTTGSTVNECIEMIKKGEPQNVGVLVIAKD